MEYNTKKHKVCKECDGKGIVKYPSSRAIFGGYTAWEMTERICPFCNGSGEIKEKIKDIPVA